MTTLASIRARLAEQDTRGSKSNSSYGDGVIYPFWNMQPGDSATIRFLPDGQESNDFFWVERSMFKLPFTGVAGNPDSKPVIVQVPCMEMYGATCKILNEVRAWFKDSSLEDMGRKYWKKRSYIFQGFVTADPLDEETPPENPIRKFIIGPQIFKVIKASLMDPDMDDLPTDYTHGLDFRLIKSDSGSGYPDYSTSNWARKERPLSDAEMAAINTYGLFNLRDSLPNQPTDVEQKIMFEMFEASVNGEEYDPERWGSYFKPAGLTLPESTGSAPAPTAKPRVTETADQDDPPFRNEPEPAAEPAPSTGTGENRAEDILAMIRARQKS